jgi:hypothetical protein
MCHIGAMSKVSRAYFGAWYGLPQGICFISYFFFCWMETTIMREWALNGMYEQAQDVGLRAYS